MEPSMGSQAVSRFKDNHKFKDFVNKIVLTVVYRNNKMEKS